MRDLFFDFHGVRVRVGCADAETAGRVAEDFAYFAIEGPDSIHAGDLDLEIDAYRRAPDYADLPPLKASMYSPRNICYTKGPVTFIDYFGDALSIYNRAEESLRIYSDRLCLLHEIVFLTMLSRVCERLERNRMHRVHALAIERRGQCAMFAMPSGGGKTTLGMRFLKGSAPYKLVSEDSPLITRWGRVLPFPLRFGVAAAEPPDVAPEHVTRLERMEFEPKYLISLRAFEGSIATGTFAPRMLFVGDRTLGMTCEIREVGFAAGFRALVRHMIVGVGLYQGVEFLLRTSPVDLVNKSGLLCSRVLAALALLRQARVFALELGRDPQRNASTIISFLDKQGFGRGL